MIETAAKNSKIAPRKKDRLHHANIEIQVSNVHRYGVFADEIILPGEVIEECPVILFEDFPSAIRNHAFAWDGKKSAMALGCGGIYNHSDEPNALYQKDHVNQTINFIAQKPIYRGEEIFINYGKDWFRERVLGSSAPYVKRRKNTIKHIVFLSLFLLVACYITPLVAKYHAPFVPALTSVLHK